MSKAILLSLVLMILFASGCTSRPAETIKISGLEKTADSISEALKHNAVLNLRPVSIQVGDKDLVCIPNYNIRDSNFSLQFGIYELVDGELRKLDLVQPSSE